MKVPFCDLRVHDAALRRELSDAFGRVMAGGRFVLGSEVEAFEREFAAYCGRAHAVGVGCGLDALRLILMGYGIGAGDGVVVPSNTYVATWMAVTLCGAAVVPVEPDDTLNIDPGRVEAALTTRTRAIMAVHLYGRSADMAALRGIADRYGLRLIVDACQAHGVKSLGDAAAFSFYPTKNLGCYGDGGAVVTDDAALAARVRALRNYGSERRNENAFVGINSRLDEMQAAFLRVRLRWLDRVNDGRRANARLYDAALGAEPARDHVYHQYVTRVVNREAFRARMLMDGVETDVHYPTPPHMQPCYASAGLGRFSVAEAMADEVVSLPVAVTREAAEYVACRL